MTFVNNVDARKIYNQNKTSKTTTIVKYFVVSSFVGQTTCLISLKESLKNCIIKNFLIIKKCYNMSLQHLSILIIWKSFICQFF